MGRTSEWTRQLTLQELKILALKSRGYEHKEVACILGISLRLVNLRLEDVRIKLGTDSNYQSLVVLGDLLSSVDLPELGQSEAQTQIMLSTLTQEERKILALKGRGYSNKQISAILHLSPRTVYMRLQKLRTRLATKNNWQLLGMIGGSVLEEVQLPELREEPAGSIAKVSASHLSLV